MARIQEPTPEELAGYRAWVASRPPAVRAVAERFDPWSLYRLKSTGQRVVIRSFSELVDVTLTVLVSGDFNAIAFERAVFGINPDNLEPCEFPDPAEPVGALLTQTEVDENIDQIRVIARPDIWVWDETIGRAVRKQ